MSTQTTIWAGCHQLPQQLPAGTNSPPSPTCNLLDKWNLFTPLPRHPLKTAKTFKWLCMKCCPASFCLKDSSLPLPPFPPHPLNNFCAKMKRRPQAVGAPGHEGLLQRRQGTGWVRHGRGPGGTAQLPAPPPTGQLTYSGRATAFVFLTQLRHLLLSSLLLSFLLLPPAVSG